MRRALRRAASVTLLVCALFAPSIGNAADPRPVVRVVLTGGETPAWFEGFVKHLQSELGLRGIEVAVARGASAPLVRGGDGLRPRADAELVVEAPSPLRPVLRFSVAPAEGTPPVESSSSRVRNVNLAGVPNDGCALAMAVSADELMRSNWPRAVPSAAPAATAEGKGSSAPPGKEPAAPNPPEAVTRPPEAAARSEESKPKARVEPASGIETSAPEADQGAIPADATSAGFSTAADQGTSRVSIGAAAAGEAFAGKQMQFGPDLRVGFRVMPRLELGVRAGWRRVAPRDTPNGSIDGSAIVAGGALDVLVLGGGRATLWLVGRADVLRAVYTGRPRDATTSLGDTQGAFGFVVSAGPLGRIAVSRTVSLEGELLAGASPLAATATDTWNPMVSTNGAAIMASLGLSLGL
jgi:hypothetical protein